MTLLPLSFAELSASPEGKGLDAGAFAVKGGYPRIYDAGIPQGVYFRSYVDTYVQRDVAGLVTAGNLQAFRSFLALCAHAAGNLLNVTRLASDVGVSAKTARAWLSILESSYVVYRLQALQANLRKQVTKTPKLFFYDTGLLCYLLGIGTKEQLRDSVHRGKVYENLVITETLKRHVNAGREPQLRFYRDDSGNEVDLVDLTDPSAPEFVEVKSSRTFEASYVTKLAKARALLETQASGRISQHVVMRADEAHVASDTKIWPMEAWMLRR